MNGELIMTKEQQIAALRAIFARQKFIWNSLGPNPSSVLRRYASRELEALDGVFDAICAIKTEG